MSATNLAIVFGPTLLPTKDKVTPTAHRLEKTYELLTVCHSYIQNCCRYVCYLFFADIDRKLGPYWNAPGKPPELHGINVRDPSERSVRGKSERQAEEEAKKRLVDQ